ncbi:MAG: flagellar hook protein FlgE [Gammaproteobacteria bacterium]|nr:flagellar hook protein FlgE [Gammaproteobacteria bacterium]
MPFKIALSGLHAASTDLSVTGNNIANANTSGFKQSRAEFVDVYASAYGAISATTSGSGVRTDNVRQLFSQGNVEYTDNSTDLAITGQGFFVVKDSKGRYLTRNGTFGLDRDGFVQNATGQRLQIFPIANPATATTPATFNYGRLTDLQMSNTIGAPVASTAVAANLNLDANVIAADYTGSSLYTSTTVGATPGFNPLLSTTYHYSTATTIYDSLGAPHTAMMYFRKVGDTVIPVNNAWQTYLYVDGTLIPPSNTNTPGSATGEGAPTDAALLSFNNNGTLNSTSTATTPVPLRTTIAYSTITTTTGSAPIDLTIDFGGTTQYGSDFAANTLSQDGFTTGRLTGFDVEDSGQVFARYTNGNRTSLGMVALANVPNPQGLRQKGDSLWTESFEAGDTVIGQPGTASLGLIQSGALESSTVEIADQLVNLIVAQRNYQANAQVIQTADQLTQTLMNIR